MKIYNTLLLLVSFVCLSAVTGCTHEGKTNDSVRYQYYIEDSYFESDTDDLFYVTPESHPHVIGKTRINSMSASVTLVKNRSSFDVSVEYRFNNNGGEMLLTIPNLKYSQTSEEDYIFEEMKTMSLLAKVKHKDPTVITPKEALAMATVNGALAQGRNDCGLVKEGYKADLVMINLDTPNMAPTHDLLSNLVLAGTDREIEMTMVDGKILYERGEFKTIDIEETLAKVKESVEDILNRGNIN